MRMNSVRTNHPHAGVALGMDMSIKLYRCADGDFGETVVHVCLSRSLQEL
jgi:hypothetical protein